MLATVLLLFISPLALWYLYWYYWTNYFEKYLKNIPGPKGWPLLGNALELQSSVTILPRLMKHMKEYNGSFKVYVGAQPFYFLCDPKNLDFILSSTTILKKSIIYKFVTNWLGLGLLTSWGSRWRKHRKIITPAFHFKILEDFVDVFNSQGDTMVSIMKKKMGKDPIDLYPLVTRCALDIICETAMGTSVHAQEGLESEYVKCVNILLEVLIARSFSPSLANDFFYLFSKTYWRERAALKVVHDYTNSVIKKRKAEYFTGDRAASVDSLGRKKKQAFLDLMLEYSLQDPSFTDEDIRQEVDTFMFEGYDTTATSITFALFALAIHPDVQKKAYDEVNSIFADDPKRSATYRDLQEMKYLEMAIKESLRIYTTVPMVGRVLEKDVDWNGTMLPKGLMLNIFMYGIQNSDAFENTAVFDPERFSSENSKGRDPFIYIPFSAGARNCIGQKFAMLEMKSTISNVLRNFELLPTDPCHNVVLKSDGVMKSDNGVFIQMKPRS